MLRVLGILFLLLLSSCDERSQTKESREIILAHAMSTNHPVSQAMELLKDRAAEISGGELTVKIYSGGMLGSERKLLELLQMGAIGMTKVSAATLENIVPAASVLNLPYLFRDEDHASQVLYGDIGRDLLREGESYRLKGMAYYDAGSRSLYTVNQPVNSPADLQGLKLRVMESVTAMKLMDTMGGSPTPLSYGELYTAFQGGMVDGAENNPPSFFNSRHYEVCSYYILNEHATIPDILVMDTRLWNSLNEQEQRWLRQAIDESVEYQLDLWEQSEEESLQAVQEAGVEIIRPDKEPFREATRSMYRHIEETDPALHNWVERIKNVQS